MNGVHTDGVRHPAEQLRRIRTLLVRGLDALLFEEEDRCPVCGTPGAGFGQLCPVCMERLELVGAWHDLSPYVCYTAAFYNNALRSLFAAYKFKGATYLEPVFQHFMTDFVRKVPAFRAVRWISFVPQTSRNDVLRGVNPAYELAAAAAQELHVPLLPLLLRRPGGFSQKRMRAAERLKNVRGAYEVRQRIPAEARIGPGLVIDDFLTTGNTMREVLSVLEEKGIHGAGLCLACVSMPPEQQRLSV